MSNPLLNSSSITVCIPTHKRPELLRALLGDIVQQTRCCNEIVVVDNDPAESARTIVEAFALKMLTIRPALAVHYDVQPVKNISLTRNRTIALARSEWMAFIDDDERAPSNWLELMLTAASRYKADGILAPVVPTVPDNAPRWIKRGRFYDLPRAVTGQVVPASNYKFGNVLLRAQVLREEAGPFDPAYGTTGGEDGDLLCRLELKGIKLIWSDDAVVYEPVEQKRLSAKWLLMRAMRGGQDFARHTSGGRYGSVTVVGKTVFVIRALLQLVIASILLLIVLPLGVHRAMRWAIKLAANFGKLSYFWGWHYQEYA